MKKLFVILASLLIILGLATTTLIYLIMGRPEYSLWQFKQAYDQNDAATAEQYLNVEAVSAQMVEVVFAKAASVFGGMLDGNGKGVLATAAKQSLQTTLEEQLRAELADDRSDPLFKPLQPMTLQDVVQHKTVQCDTTGNTAMCTITSADGPIVLQLEHVSHSVWQIVGVANIDKLLEQRLSQLSLPN